MSTMLAKNMENKGGVGSNQYGKKYRDWTNNKKITKPSPAIFHSILNWKNSKMDNSQKYEWIDKNFTAETAQKWDQYDFSPDEANTWIDVGIVSSEEAYWYKENNLSPIEAVKQRRLSKLSYK